MVIDECVIEGLKELSFDETGVGSDDCDFFL